jgi:hypothetical protein
MGYRRIGCQFSRPGQYMKSRRRQGMGYGINGAGALSTHAARLALILSGRACQGRTGRRECVPRMDATLGNCAPHFAPRPKEKTGFPRLHYLRLCYSEYMYTLLNILLMIFTFTGILCWLVVCFLVLYYWLSQRRD